MGRNFDHFQKIQRSLRVNQAGSYRLPELSESLQPGQAFWIIQHTGEPVTLNLPESFASVTADRQDPSGPCVNGCFELDLPASSGNPTQWNMIGLPSDKSVSTASMRVDDGDGGCPVIFSNDPFDQSAPPAVSYDCTLATARASNVMSDQFFRYNGAQYEVVGSAGSVNRWHPWDGFWSAVLSSGTSPIQIVIPAP